MTDWQVRAGAVICGAISNAHGIPLTYYDGPRQQVGGFLAHASVPTSNHTDRLTHEDWGRIVAQAGGQPQPEPQPEPQPQPQPDGSDLVAVAAAIAAASKQTVKQGSKGIAAKWAQILLNAKLEGPDLIVDGVFGPASVAAAKTFQRNVKNFFKLTNSQMPVDGIVGPATWFWLTR